MDLTKTDKTTLAGLYIAKFDKLALEALGLSGMGQAFNVIGFMRLVPAAAEQCLM